MRHNITKSFAEAQKIILQDRTQSPITITPNNNSDYLDAYAWALHQAIGGMYNLQGKGATEDFQSAIQKNIQKRLKRNNLCGLSAISDIGAAIIATHLKNAGDVAEFTVDGKTAKMDVKIELAQKTKEKFDKDSIKNIVFGGNSYVLPKATDADFHKNVNLSLADVFNDLNDYTLNTDAVRKHIADATLPATVSSQDTGLEVTVAIKYKRK